MLSSPSLLRLIVLFHLLLLSSLVPLANASKPVSPEYVIKAAYIYNFAMFVDWPADAFLQSDSPIVIGLVGPDPFGSALEEIIRGKRVNKRHLIIKRAPTATELTDAHILFFSASESAKISEMVQQFRRTPVLVVSETPDFLRRGSVINFTVQNNKVGCAINIAAARKARLNISSQLLSLSTVVEGGF